MRRARPFAAAVAALGATAVLLAGCQRESAAPPAASAASAAAATPVVASAPPAPPAARGPIVPPTPGLAPPSDEERAAGASLAAQGGGEGVPACASCHGAQGEGNAQTGFPRLAGQSATYLLQQLQSYVDGTRVHPVMGPIAKALSAPQRRAGAAHYAALAPAAPASGAASPVAPRAAVAARAAAPPGPARGRQLAVVGDESRMLQACANCHGPDGTGSGAINPYLAGQPASYLHAALGAWRNGSRRNDPSAQMPFIAKAMADSDLEAVAAYYAALPPPTRALDAPAAPMIQAAAASAVTSGPREAGGQALGVQGSGTEQGAAPGVQGPGGAGGSASASPGGPAARPASAPAAARASGARR